MILPQHRRKPAFTESYFLCVNVEKFYTNFNVVGQFNKRFSKSALSHALMSMIANNSWLTYNFFPISNKLPKNYHDDYELRPVDTIHFDKVVEYRKIAEFNELTLETIDGFKNQIGCTYAPLWQLCVFETEESQYVCGYFCHTLADGGTALQFQRDLAKGLASSENETEVVDVLFDYEKAFHDLPDILPARELLTDLYIPSIFGRVRFWMEMNAPILVNWLYRGISYLKSIFGLNENKLPLFTSCPVTKDLASKFKLLNFPPDEVKAITDYCRRNKITLTPFLSIIALDCLEKIIFPHFPQSNGSTQYSTSHYMAISGRRYYPQFTNPFLYGVYVCGAPVNFKAINAASNEDLLIAMKKFHQSIQEEIETRRSFKLLWMWNVADISRTLNRKLGKLRRYTTTISNLGMVKDDPDCSWKLVNAWFSLNISIGYHFILDMVSTETGGLNLVIPYMAFYDELKAEVDNKVIPAMELFKTQFRKTCELLVTSEQRIYI